MVADLKYTRMVGNFTIVHATLDVRNGGATSSTSSPPPQFPLPEHPGLLLRPHHVPVAFMRDTAVRGGTYSKFKWTRQKIFRQRRRRRPARDNNPKAAYVIYDVDAGTIELRRLEYDIPATQRKILAAACPNASPSGWNTKMISESRWTRIFRKRIIGLLDNWIIEWKSGTAPFHQSINPFLSLSSVVDLKI